MLLRLLNSHLFRPHRQLLIVVFFLQLIQTLATLYLPTLNADIIDKGVLRGDTGYIWRIGGVMLAATVVQVAFNIGAIYYGSKAAAAFGRDVRGDLFHRVVSFSAQEVARLEAPSLITRTTNDVEQVRMLVQMACTLFVAAPIMAIGGVIMAFREDIELSWVMIAAVVVLVVGMGNVVARMVPSFRLMQERIDDVNRILREQITGIRVVRAFVREPEEVSRFRGANDQVTDAALRAGRTMALTFPVVMLTLNIASIAVLWVGAGRVDSGDLQIGSLVAFLSYLAQVLMSVTMATFMLTMVPRATVCAERIIEVLDTEPSVVDHGDNVRADAEGTLEFRNVEFAYPGAELPVLRGVSFAVRPGQTTAVIGSTGAGKTSLLNLVPRLFDVTGGAVLVGGIDVRDMALETLWSKIGLVPQRPHLFSGTVATNLRFGKPDASDEELWEALRIAQADDFVADMPDGLESRVDQGGVNVSGGQRQRLAIARAIISQPAIYLFDDSFSALDLATDARLRAALAPAIVDATVVIVAQRVSTIVNADQIVVLEDGEVVGRGTHDELLSTCPTYVEIVDSQFSAEEAA